MALTMAEVARDYETDGVPSSGSHKIKKGDMRNWGAWVEGILNAFTANGGLIYSSKAALDADISRGANTMAWVIGDPTVGNNGIYRKIGASGAGSWTRVSDLPFSFIIASDTGAGTANAIQATTSLPVSSSALVWMNVFEANTASPVTVSFNGGAPLTVKTNTGNNVAAGGLVAGMIVLGIVSGSTFRLVSDQASSAVLAVLAAAEAAAAEAQAAFEAIADLTSSRLAIKLKTSTTSGVLDYVLDVVIPAENAHTLVNVYVQGVLQPKDGFAYTVIEGGTKLHLSADPGTGVDLYVEGAAAYANPLPFDLPTVVEAVRDQAPWADFTRWVTDPSAPDWAPYFNQCLSDVNASSGGRGTRIILPCRDIPISQVAPFSYNGVNFEGAYRAYWEGEAYGTRLIPIAGGGDLFTIGTTGADTEGFSIKNVRIDAGAMGVGTVIYKATRVRMFTVENCSHRDPYNFAEIVGGIDICFERAHCEAYRNLGLNVVGTDHRVDRLTLRDFKISGAGTESEVLSNGPAISLGGQVETVDSHLLQIVKIHSGIRCYEDGGHAPRFLTFLNTQIEYCQNALLNIEACYDLKATAFYANTNLSGSAFAIGTGARNIKLASGNVTGAHGSAITFSGKDLSIDRFGFQDWNRGGGGEPCIDLATGYDLADIHRCQFGKLGGEGTSGAGAGTRALRNNSGAGRSFVDGNRFASDLHATPIQNNGSVAPVDTNNQTA